MDTPLVRSKSWSQNGFIAFFLIFFLSLAFIFFLDQFHLSARDNFSVDELFGIKHSARGSTFTRLISQGADGQGSPSPLDYLAVKILDQIRNDVHWFGLRPKVYYRLFAIVVTALGCFYIAGMLMFLILKNQESLWIKAVQLLLLLEVAFVFFFSEGVHYWAHQTRPYALWNTLWMVVLAMSFLKKLPNRVLITSLVVLSFSAIASIYQIGLMAIVYFFIDFEKGTAVKKRFKETLKVFGAPLMIIFYYAMHIGNWDYPYDEGAWDRFIRFWLSHIEILFLMGTAALLCFLKDENKKYAIAPLSSLLLYLIGPFIFVLTQMSGFFYDKRQFIYYDLTTAIFILTIMHCIPAYLRGVTNKNVMMFIVLIIILSGSILSLKSMPLGKFKTAGRNAGVLLSDNSAIKLHSVDTLYWAHDQIH